MTPRAALQHALDALTAERSPDPARAWWLAAAAWWVRCLLAYEPGAARPQPATDVRPDAPSSAPRGEA